MTINLFVFDDFAKKVLNSEDSLMRYTESNIIPRIGEKIFYKDHFYLVKDVSYFYEKNLLV